MRIAGVLLFVVVLAVAIGTSLGGDDEPDDGANPAATPTAPDPSAAPTEADTSGEVACGGERPEPADSQQYNKPKQVLKKGVDYSAVISTSCGDITLDLLEEEAEETVNNFVFLAQEGYFDGLIWHRVERNFVIQTGDPNGLNGVPPDGPGYAIKDELPGKSSEYVLGTLAMANSGPDTGGSQIFIITHGVGKDGEIEPAGLPKAYAIFGQVDEASFEVLGLLDELKTQGGEDQTSASMPINPAFINSIEIIEN
ncbi:MAG: peptidylprolyl isomerase [Actinobacteria bacterium]|nr:peptidylprolyl isomerase [Actinomycetota bacterium]